MKINRTCTWTTKVNHEAKRVRDENIKEEWNFTNISAKYSKTLLKFREHRVVSGCWQRRHQVTAVVISE
jgi:hypothetical protein